ncbi:MAG: hypothetical protein PHC54_05480 [Candidatus Omnitrophica bacterium]|nr:hypothetical protein [Candidatus Omnitrophota bacterium]MDD5592648.1 hypothetical protein [Candidatus Omnitrophota bacterium]
MYTGLNINETKKFISKNDPDKENPTIFHLGALDQIVKQYIEDNTIKYEASSSDPEAEAIPKILFATRALLIVKFGIRKIENFINPETKQVVTLECEKIIINDRAYLAMPDKIIAIFPYGALIVELAEEILKLNSLSEGEAKN